MNRLVPTSLVLALLLLAATSVHAAHLKLFVLTGQSNSLGTTDGDGAEPSPGPDPTDAAVHFYWHNLANAAKSLGDSGGVFTTLREQQGASTKAARHTGDQRSGSDGGCIAQECAISGSSRLVGAAAEIRFGPRPPLTITCMTMW